ncbi:ABC transporter ATP-binding protein [Microbispora sp. KK1-11]|uniref:ABC transporter ATP-binding protein n=1 Tax=Microbispora sp. KK1-11 TaxID=2053005 RepID=UPI00115B9544|nr:ABC transporter ATP-binding protein [Microbispora sp. KK1-11]TQS25186.1 ABC transporter ATP-binding protein [Microbispora sp. KK1-11]
MALKVPGARRSAPANIIDALRLSREASPGLFWLVVVALPAAEGLISLALLAVFRGGADAFLRNQSAPGETVDRIIPWLAVAIALTLLVVLMGNSRHTVQELLLDRVRQFSARRMHRAVAMLELADFDDSQVHDRISRAEATADFKPRQVVRGITALIASGFQIVVFTAMLVFLQPLLLPMLALAAAPVLLISSKLAGEQFGFFHSVTPLERRRRYVGWLMTSRQPAAEVRAFGLMPHFAKRYDALTDERYTELRRMVHGQWRKLLAGQVSFGLVLTAAVALLGWFFASGRMDVPTLLTTVVALSRLVTAVGGLGGPIAELSEAGLFLGDQAAFYEQLKRADELERGQALPERLRELHVRDLSFRYPGAEREALSGVNMTIGAGQLVAFVGPNGSGKTTLAKILAFLYRPGAGTVTWNGQDIADLDRRALRDHVTAVFQDHMTYHFTVEENVSLGDVARADDHAAVAEAIDAAGAADMVARLPAGAATELGPEFGDGTSLSGGESQRLALARAIFRGRELVILDEPTSALDPVADHALLRDLRELLHGRTAIVISHRFSNVRHADQIYVLDGGRIVEQGSHESLMLARGLYAEMYSLQANAFAEEPA